MGIGMSELLIILVIIMVIFGAGRLPELGAGLGKAISGFKKAVEDKDHNITPPAEKARVEAAQKSEAQQGGEAKKS